MPQGLDLGVPWGVTMGGWVVKKIFFPKFNQIWCVSNLHQWHMQGHNFFWPHPLGPQGGAKKSNIIKSQSQSQFQRFLNQTLCVFSQLKDIKHIRRDFHSVAWVMPQGWDLGVPWGLGVPKTFFPNSTRFSVWVTYMNGTCNGTFFCPRLLESWGGAKRSNITKSQLQSQFHRFLNLTLCVFSQMKDIKHIRWDFHSVPWVMHTPGFGI